MEAPQAQPQGLSNLMEAATALAKLTGNQNDTASCPSALKRNTTSDEDGTVAATSSTLPSLSNLGAHKEIFPQRLMAILNDAALANVCSWLPHGRSFAILRPDVFTETVLPKYLPPLDGRSAPKFPSFTRKLNRWFRFGQLLLTFFPNSCHEGGFRQATRGPDTGAFHHPLFRRDQPKLCLEMACQRSRDRKGPKKNAKALPVKKRQITPLTKESLDAMNEQTTIATLDIQPTAVAVSEDSQSSSCNELSQLRLQHQQQALQVLKPPAQGITTDSSLIQQALETRDQEERMRVAKAMLYDAYVRAVNGE